MPEVAVIGAGITGLLAAERLSAAGAHVTVLDAAERVGGQLRSVTFAGRTVDLGAEAMHTAAPGPVALAERLSLHDQLQTAHTGTTWISTSRGLRALPAGFGPAGPTRLAPMIRSRVLSPIAALRAGTEPLLPRTSVTEDRSVGDYLDRRFGRQVTDRLVDPLLGALHSGDVRRLSIRAATPQLASLAARHRSLLLHRRQPAPADAAVPSFVTLRGGMASLADALMASLTEVEVRLGTTVTDLRRSGARTVVSIATGETLEVDGVIAALPTHAAAPLLDGSSPTAAAGLRELRAASVAVAAVSYPATELPVFRGTGLLMPSTSGRLLKAAIFLTTKWPHLRTDERMLVRLSAGRIDDDRAAALDDDTLVERLHAELSEVTSLCDGPEAARVQRWPSTMPQLEVGHHDRLRAIVATVDHDLPGTSLAGAPYQGPGLAACVRSAADAAERVTRYLEERTA